MTSEDEMVAAFDRAWEQARFDRPARRGEKRWAQLRRGEIVWYQSDEELAGILRERGFIE